MPSKALLTRAASVTAAILLATTAQVASAAETFTVNFTQINGMGASGTATLMLNDDATSLSIDIQATGLNPGGPHLGHIHGLFSNVTTGVPVNSTTPTLAQDTDGDGFVELAEGLVTYGPIIVDFGNVDPNLDGTVNFQQTFDLLDPGTYANGYTREDLLGMDFASLDLREVVLHGMNVPAGVGTGTPGEVNGTAGFSVLLPVLSGEIMSAVPEPSTWAFMVFGFGAVGYSLRAKRREHTATLAKA